MRPKPALGVAPTTNRHLPPIDTALGELGRRHAHAIGGLIARTVAVVLLTVLITLGTPGLRAYRPLFDAVGGILILWPFLTTTGRLYAWRIALGRSYAQAGLWTEAERTLLPLRRPRTQLYDAAGEGRYYLAAALLALERPVEAEALLARLAVEAKEPWRERAKQANEIRDPERIVALVGENRL